MKLNFRNSLQLSRIAAFPARVMTHKIWAVWLLLGAEGMASCVPQLLSGHASSNGMNWCTQCTLYCSASSYKTSDIVLQGSHDCKIQVEICLSKSAQMLLLMMMMGCIDDWKPNYCATPTQTEAVRIHPFMLKLEESNSRGKLCSAKQISCFHVWSKSATFQTSRLQRYCFDLQQRKVMLSYLVGTLEAGPALPPSQF